MAAKLTGLIHKVAIKMRPMAQSCTICSFRSRRPQSGNFWIHLVLFRQGLKYSPLFMRQLLAIFHFRTAQQLFLFVLYTYVLLFRHKTWPSVRDYVSWLCLTEYGRGAEAARVHQDQPHYTAITLGTPTVWGMFNIHGVSGGDSTSVFRWLSLYHHIYFQHQWQRSGPNSETYKYRTSTLNMFSIKEA
jgi:hypothetical protein